MELSESQFQIATEIVSNNLRDIVKIENFEIASAAHNFATRTVGGELGIALHSGEKDISGISSFWLYPKSKFQVGAMGLQPFMLVSQDKILTSQSADIIADFIRSIFIAQQYPNNGYQRPMKDVYGEAFEKQAKFLKSQDYPRVDLDPRFDDWHELRLKLIGRSRLIYDCGFDDYYKAMMEMEKEEEEEDYAIEKSSDINLFLEAREYVMRNGIPTLTSDRLASGNDLASGQTGVLIADHAFAFPRISPQNR